jgi:hypothetical protein
MAIRVQHDIGGMGGLAAYAAGAGKRQERQRKYALDLYRDNQKLAQQQALKLQERQWDIDDAATRRQQQLDDAAINRQQELEDIKNANTREALIISADSVPEIPDHITAPQKRRELQNQADALRIMAREFDPNDPDMRQKFEEQRRLYEQNIANLPERNEAEIRSKGITYYDPKTQRHYNENQEGFIPIGADDKPVAGWVYQQEQEAAKALAEEKKQERAAKEKKAQDDAAAAELKKSQEAYDKRFNEVLDSVRGDTPLKDFKKDEAIAEVTKFLGPRPTAPVASGGGGGGSIPEIAVGDDGRSPDDKPITPSAPAAPSGTTAPPVRMPNVTPTPTGPPSVRMPDVTPTPTGPPSVRMPVISPPPANATPQQEPDEIVVPDEERQTIGQRFSGEANRMSRADAERITEEVAPIITNTTASDIARLNSTLPPPPPQPPEVSPEAAAQDAWERNVAAAKRMAAYDDASIMQGLEQREAQAAAVAAQKAANAAYNRQQREEELERRRAARGIVSVDERKRRVIARGIAKGRARKYRLGRL